MSKYLTLESILGKDAEELTALRRGEITTAKLGTIPFCEIKQDEYKQIKKDCMHMVKDPNGSRGAMVSELDDDKFMAKLVIAAVDKESKQPDARSNFTFANADLLSKLGVITADSALNKLMGIGEIYNASTAIQETCGFTEKAHEEEAEDIKN